jgi:hypothetical protein
MTTVSTINGRPHAQSADQSTGLKTRELKTAWAILIETSCSRSLDSDDELSSGCHNGSQLSISLLRGYLYLQLSGLVRHPRVAGVVNSWLYWCGWQTVGSTPDGKSFSRCREGRNRCTMVPFSRSKRKFRFVRPQPEQVREVPTGSASAPNIFVSASLMNGVRHMSIGWNK